MLKSIFLKSFLTALLYIPASAFQSTSAQQAIFLTSEQEREILSISEVANAAIFEEYEGMRVLEQELNSLMYSSDASNDEISEVYSKLQASLVRASELNFEKNLAIRTILPPELREPYSRALQQNLSNLSSELSTDNVEVEK